MKQHTDYYMDQKLAARVRNICVNFAKAPILQNINLDIPKYGVTVLVGRSGSGKTTLLRCFNRLNECFDHCQTQGDILVRLPENTNTPQNILTNISNKSFGDPCKLRAHVGMVFQHPDVLPLSIARNMALPLRHVLNLNDEEIKHRTQKALKRVALWSEIENRLHTSAENLSGGQQQRLCLARALALHPVMLLLDEPTSSLDTVSARIIEDLIRTLAHEYPLIMVSHSLSQALSLADRLVFMSKGHIVRTWDKEEGLPALVELENMLETME